MLQRLRTPAQPTAAFQPDWERMEGDHDYFCWALQQLLKDCGYKVLSIRVVQEPLEKQARVCALFLQRDNQAYVALGLRWVITVTSDVVSRFGRQLTSSRAGGGMIITTSLFTDAAIQAALRPPIQLYDRHRLWTLLEAQWSHGAVDT